uniref:Uncharacterized protein n=1 Tax=Rhizophora mucronata TaxID=61149 RepID=A0A2P2PYB9_RHIMU
MELVSLNSWNTTKIAIMRTKP